MSRTLVLMIVFLPTLGLFGQQKDSSLNLDPVVITGQHQALSAQKSVYRVNILDRSRIEAQAANTLADLMVTELSTNLYQDPVLGSVMQLQGISGENVKILIDGVPVVGRLGGDLDLSQLPLNQVERVEVIEGPMSVEFGTNALAGVINLITKKSDRRDWGADVSLYEANVGNGYSIHEGFHNISGSYFTNLKKHRFSVNGGRNFFGGSFGEKDIREKTFHPKVQGFGGLGYDWSGKKLRLSVKSEYFDELLIRKGSPAGAYIPRALDENYQTIRMNQRLTGQYQIGPRTSIKGNLAYSTYRREKSVYSVDLTNGAQTRVAAQDNLDGFNAWASRATLSSELASFPLSWQLGYDVNLESASGGKILSGTQYGNDLAIFSSAEYRPFDKLTFRPGVRFSYNSLYQAPVSPSLHIKLSPVSSTQIRLSYARGFRAPSLKELFFEFIDVNHHIVGNPDLKAEYSHNFQLSGNWKKLVGNQLLRMEIAGFYNEIRNKIDLALVGQSTTSASYFNIDQARVTGLQTKFTYQREQLKVSLGGALLGRENSLGNGSDTEFSNFNFSHNFQSNLNWTIFKTGFSVNVFYKYTGAIQGFRTVANETEIDLEPTRIGAYHIADISLRKSWWGKKLNSSIGVKNLFNVSQIAANTSGGAHSGDSGSALIAFGRNFFVQLGLNLGKEK